LSGGGFIHQGCDGAGGVREHMHGHFHATLSGAARVTLRAFRFPSHRA
jgi:hypothetical protein